MSIAIDPDAGHKIILSNALRAQDQLTYDDRVATEPSMLIYAAAHDASPAIWGPLSGELFRLACLYEETPADCTVPQDVLCAAHAVFRLMIDDEPAPATDAKSADTYINWVRDVGAAWAVNRDMSHVGVLALEANMNPDLIDDIITEINDSDDS